MRHADAYGLTRGRAGRSTPRACGRASTRSSSRSRATDDDAERFEAEGVDVLLGAARLTSPTTVRVGEVEHEARFILLATGSRPSVPPIDGLAEAGFLTSERIFELDRAPASLVMIGAGPISIELAQGLTRLGVPVTVLQKGPAVLEREEPELAARLLARLRAEGVDVVLDVDVDRVSVAGGFEDRPRGRALVAGGGDLRRRRPDAERRRAGTERGRREGRPAGRRGRRPAAHEREVDLCRRRRRRALAVHALRRLRGRARGAQHVPAGIRRRRRSSSRGARSPIPSSRTPG